MAPYKVAEVAAAPMAPRAKRNRMPMAVATAKSTEVEANNSTHRELVENDIWHTEVLQPEITERGLHHPPP